MLFKWLYVLELLNEKKREIKHTARLCWFIFKWFLIGKYHCRLPKWTCKVWWFIHKSLWFSIAFSVAFTLHEIAQRIG